ncbi:3 beta-hydroxysteroid dehydrogenase/Delta 5--_4-isomerase type 3 [Bulinus truncatus]|nr:3 beta-hydroxysteroid dehydrogenase/Delta 5-->4-isomerase type 3 [Bulinus truncatus]
MFYMQSSRILKRALQFTARRLCVGVNRSNSTPSSGEHRPPFCASSGLISRAVLTECTRATSLFIVTSGLHYSAVSGARSRKDVGGMETNRQEVRDVLDTADEVGGSGPKGDGGTGHNGVKIHRQTESTHEWRNEDGPMGHPTACSATTDTEGASCLTTMGDTLLPKQNTIVPMDEDGEERTGDCHRSQYHGNKPAQTETQITDRDDGGDDSTGLYMNIAGCPFSEQHIMHTVLSDRTGRDEQGPFTPDEFDIINRDRDDPISATTNDSITPANDKPISPASSEPITPISNDPISPTNDDPIVTNISDPCTPATTDPIAPYNPLQVATTLGQIYSSQETPAADACAVSDRAPNDPLWSPQSPDEPSSSAAASAVTTATAPATSGEGDIVVVTGGSGFLGQHIVKLIHERAPHVSEILVYDVMPFEQKLDYQATKRVRSIVGSVTDAELMTRSLKGATSVIHVAGLISWGTFPDVAGMQEVNVRGTQNVLNACRENSIQRLIYCSTVDVAIGTQPIRGGDETNTPVPDKFLFPGYPETKFQGERIVLGLGHPTHYGEPIPCILNTGQGLQTVVLRANVCYGELDNSYVTNALRTAKKSKGILKQIGDGTAMFQQAYVGNTAWAFICADRAMKENPQLDSEIFYIPDNTPIQNSFNFMRPYLEANGLQLSEKPVSYPLVHWAVSVLEKLVQGLSPLVKINLPFQSHTIAYINTDFYFCGSKARKLLNFEPLFSAGEAREMSMKYYTSVDLDRDPTTS